MIADRWNQIEEIFEHAVKLDEGARITFLDETCAGNHDLRTEVESLLVASDSAQEFIESPVFKFDARKDIPSELPADRTIGQYKVLRLLGAGGMGVVYEAEQSSPHRTVALKVMRAGHHADETSLRRFEREIEALALLQHPSIADIYEAGQTDTGEYYFAMELVSGESLQTYLKNRDLSIDDRLKLFVRICDAVSYAHQRRVIHRDLKPSNILVDTTTQGDETKDTDVPVKVLDFGLARITDSDTTLATSVTEAGRIIGTLAYMSPEQTQGEPDAIDVRTDIYSLGVVLYEMLTDHLPHEVAGLMPHQAIRRINEELPRRPSSINHSLRGDIEVILLKALEKDPDLRYQSASEFADDVRRFLAGLPIHARPPSAAYQLRMLAVRHKLAVVFSSVLLLLLIGFAVVSMMLVGRISTQRNLATAEAQHATLEAQKALAAQSFLESVLTSSDPKKALGKDFTVRELLDQASEQIKTNPPEHPEVRASAHAAIGNTYNNIGAYEASASHLRAALDIRQNLYENNNIDVATSLNDLGFTLRHMGENDQAESLYQQAIDMFDQLLGAGHIRSATARNNLAAVLLAKGRYDEAEPILKETLQIREENLGLDHIDVAQTLNQLGLLHNARRDTASASVVFERALQILQTELPEDHPWVMDSLYNFASLMQRLGEWEKAEEGYRKVLALDRKVYGETHANVGYSLNSLAIAVEARGDFDAAEALYHEAIEVFTAAVGPKHELVGVSMGNLATLLGNAGRSIQAEPFARGALEVSRAAYGDRHPLVASHLTKLAMVLRDMKNFEEAELALREALDIRREIFKPDNPVIADNLNELGLLARKRGDYPAAEAFYRESLELYQSRYGADSVRLAQVLGNLAQTLWNTSSRSEVEAIYQRAIDIDRAHRGSEHPHVALMLTNLAYYLLQIDDPAAAQPLLRKAIKIRRASLREDHPHTAESIMALSSALLALDQPADAANAARDGLRIFMQELPPSHWRIPDAQSRLGACLAAAGDTASAEPMLLKSYNQLQKTVGNDSQETQRALARIIEFYENIGNTDSANQYRSLLNP